MPSNIRKGRKTAMFFTFPCPVKFNLTVYVDKFYFIKNSQLINTDGGNEKIRKALILQLPIK